jgi:hypothetical protein
VTTDEYHQETLDDFLFVVPGEDFGTGTQQDYRYQAEVAASLCFSMLTQDRIADVVCEWNEDIVLRFGTPPYSLELISVKYRGSGVWPSIAQLCDDGGLAHLFDRWLAYPRPPRARLYTNGKLGGAKTQPTPCLLGMACADQDFTSQGRSVLAAHVSWGIVKAAQKKRLDLIPADGITVPPATKWDSPTGLPKELVDQVLHFLSCLRFDAGMFDKKVIRDVHIRRLVEPALKARGKPMEGAADTYDSLVTKVELANRDNEGNPRDFAAYLADPFASAVLRSTRETVQRRTIDRQVVETIISTSLSGASPSPPLLPSGARPPRAAGGQIVQEKMEVAGIEAHDRDQAASLRDLWIDTWPRVSTGFPEDVQILYRLELELVELARAVRVEVADTGAEPFGPRFQTALHKRVRESRICETVGLPLDFFHIMGFAYELSNMCKFNFSNLAAK